MNSPNVLKCCYFKAEHSERQMKRTVKNYEFDYYIEGNRTIVINDVAYNIEPDSLVIRRPGDTVSGEGPFNCYMLTLDFSGQKAPAFYDRNSKGEIEPISDNFLLQNLPTYFKPRHGIEYRKLMRLISIAMYSKTDKQKEIASLTMELLHLIAADSYSASEERSIDSDEFSFICRYMQNHLREEITLDELAAKLHFNKSYFARKFKQNLGVSPMKYLFDIRMDYARLLLSDTSLPISEIAEMSGFCDSSYFGLHFKKQFGITPLGYRKRP